MPNSPAPAPALAPPPPRATAPAPKPTALPTVYVLTKAGSRLPVPLDGIRFGLQTSAGQLAFGITRSNRRDGDVLYVQARPGQQYWEEVSEIRFHGAPDVARVIERLQGGDLRAAAMAVLGAWEAETWISEEPAPTLALAMAALRREVSRD